VPPGGWRLGSCGSDWRLGIALRCFRLILFPSAAGPPSGGPSGTTNTGRFVIQGTLNDPAAVVKTQVASPLHGNPGGLPEYIIPNWMDGGAVSITPVSGVNPEF